MRVTTRTPVPGDWLIGPADFAGRPGWTVHRNEQGSISFCSRVCDGSEPDLFRVPFIPRSGGVEVLGGEQ